MSDEIITRSYESDLETALDGERSVVARINTGSIDEFRTIIDPMGADISDFNSNAPVLWQHGSEAIRGSLPIGRGWAKVRKGNGDMIGKCFFADDVFSETLFRMYQNKTLRGWSIRMVPTEASPPTKDEIRSNPALNGCQMIYRKWKLKEFSAVAVPGNSECLSLLVSRGMWTPPEGFDRAMLESCGMAKGGAMTKPETEEMAEEDDENPDKKERAVNEPKGAKDEPDSEDAGAGEHNSEYAVKKHGEDFSVVDKDNKAVCHHATREEALKCIKDGTPGKHDGKRSALILEPESTFRVTTDGQTWYVKAPDGALVIGVPDAGLAEDIMRSLATARTFADFHKQSLEESRAACNEIRRDVADMLALTFYGKLSS